MHEETRRRLLRVAFGTFCLLPTLAVVGWTIAAALPLHTDRWEQRLRDRFGLQVTIGRISTPRPGMRRLHNITVQDLESGQTLVRLAQLEATQTGQGWRWQIDRMLLPQSALASAWQIVDRRWTRDDRLAAELAEIRVERLELTHASRPITLYKLHWLREPRPQVQRGQLAFHLSDEGADDAVTVQLARDRSAARPTTRLVLDTHGTAIPLSLVTTVAGHDVSTSASLRGRLPVEWRDGGGRAQFEGEITGLDLRRISPHWIPYPVEGLATLHVQRCRFDATGLHSIECRLQIDDLAAPAALLQSLAQIQLVTPGPSFTTAEGRDTFAASRFAVSLTLDEVGLVCKGVPDETGAPVAASAMPGALLLSDAHVRMNALICALVPQDAPDVVAKRARLMRLLPATLPW